jgi:hypothetical protein
VSFSLFYYRECIGLEVDDRATELCAIRKENRAKVNCLTSSLRWNYRRAR